MKILHLLIMIFVAFGFSSCTSAQTSEKTDQAVSESGAAAVEVYYFHNTRRCASCKVVEQVTEQSVAELYGDRVPFMSYNLETAEGKLKGDEFDVGGITVLIVSGETNINITYEGFVNARSNPDKYKQIIRENIDPLL